MLCVFKLGASRLENLRVIRCSLFLSECKDLFFVRLLCGKKKLTTTTATSNPICFNIRRVLVVSSDGVFETSLGSRDTIFKVSSRS